EGHQRPLGGVGLGFLHRRLMRLARARPRAHTAAMAVAADQGLAGAHPDPHLGDIGACGSPSPWSFPDAAQADGLAIPAVEAEHPIGLGDRIPALDIGEPLPGLPPLADGPAIELGSKGAALLGGEAHHWLRTAKVSSALASTAPGTSRPARTAANSCWRSSLG